jgi:hypothetical protein
MEQQTTIQWERGTQLAMLRDAVLPAGTGVAAITLKAVLRAIDDHARRVGECYATQETIAKCINATNTRTIKRAIGVLLDLSLITCERRKIGIGRITVNHYRIVWSELALLAHQSDKKQNIKVTLNADQSDNETHQSDIECRSKCQPCHIPRTERNEYQTQHQTLVVDDVKLSNEGMPMHQFKNTRRELGKPRRWQKRPPEPPQPLLAAAELPEQHQVDQLHEHGTD